MTFHQSSLGHEKGKRCFCRVLGTVGNVNKDFCHMVSPYWWTSGNGRFGCTVDYDELILVL